MDDYDDTDPNAPRIYVRCLAAYTGSILHGKWIDATLGADHIHEEIQELLSRSPIPNAEEWAIHDDENFGGLTIGEYEDIERVAQLGELIEEHGELFAKVYENLGDIDSVIDALENHYHGAWDDLESWAEEILRERLDSVKGSLSRWVEKETREQLERLAGTLFSYFDFEGYARRELLLDGYTEYFVDGEYHIFSDY